MVGCCCFVNINLKWLKNVCFWYDFQACGSEPTLEFDLCEDGVSVVVARGGHLGLGNHVFSGSRQHKGMVSFPLYYYLKSHFSLEFK